MHSFSEVKTPNSWVKFRLLMWKNYLQQWRHRRQTAIEFLLPVLTISLVLLIRAQIDPVHMKKVTYPVFPASSLRYSKWVLQGMDFKNLYIAYSPQSPVLNEVISNVAKKFVAKNKDIFNMLATGRLQRPSRRHRILRRNWSSKRAHIIDALQNILRTGDLIKVTAYANRAQLRRIYFNEEKTKQVIAAVEFSDKLSGSTELPLEVSFALRFPERPRLNYFYGTGGHSWKTNELYPDFEIAGPRWPFSYEGGNDPGYVNEMFIALQDLVSSELIEKLTNSNLQSFQVNIRRYPHPEYILDYTINVLKSLFPMFIMLSFCFTAVNIVRAVTVEKELQLKETMKIMGLPTWLHWMAWFWKQLIYLMISVILICIIIKVPWFQSNTGLDPYAVFTYTPFTVLLFFLTLYVCCMIFFCFMLTGFFSKGSTAALFAGVIWFLIYIPAFMFAMDASMSPYVQAFTCLSVNSAMAYGFQMLLAKESTGGLQWGQFFFSPGTEARFIFGHVVVMMILDCIIYLVIALYLEQVKPGPFGSPQPWNFFIYKDFWRGRGIKDHVDDTVDLSNDGGQSKITKENDPIGLNAGVTVENLTKIYGINVVVNNLNLVIYDDQITVLLGHNGAGKSTTISMLTGNVQVTRGTIILAGHDMVHNPKTARAYLGLCPQHNVLFNEMTVKEHLEFFARLKGFSGEKLNAEIDTMIKKLELQDKTNYQSHGLSGGQKRRLSVGIALCGGAKVVLLDEPTSGMDPASRRALWDLLQQEKKGRSMILTTHFMDEADILGDRVAIMANGRLQCVGSPYFLKQYYGVGYTLVVVKEEGFNVVACTEVINKYIPGTTIKEDRNTEITYSLPNQYSNIFQTMLNDLESSKGRINYKAYGLVATTLEDVFMSVGSDLPPKKVDNENKLSADVSTTTESYENVKIKNTTGYRLLRNHVLAIWLKLWLIWTRFWPLVVLLLLVPILIINGTLSVVHYAMASTGVLERRELTIAKGFEKTETLLSYTGTSSGSLGALAREAYNKIFESPKKISMKLTIVDNEGVDKYYLKRIADKQLVGIIRNQLLIGATFTDKDATAWFSNFGYHDVANSLSYVYQAILKAKLPNARLTVYNHPLEANYKDNTDLQLMLLFLSSQLSFGIGSSLGIVSAVFIMFYIKERVTGAKLLQNASGIRPYTMWFSAFLFDWAWFLIICIPILISCAAFQIIGLCTFAELGCLWICLMVYGAVMLPLTYFFSCIIDGPTLGFVIIFFLNLLWGMLGPQIVSALRVPQINSRTVGDIMDGILQFFPLYSLVSCVRLLNNAGLSQWSCKQSCDYLKDFSNFTECTMEVLCKFYPHTCCGYESYTPWAWADPGILRYVLSMILMSIIFWLALIVVEYRVLQHYLTRKKIPPAIDESTLDTDVLDESRKVDKIVQTGNFKEYSLVADRLVKYYEKYLATNQVSFKHLECLTAVSNKECFGLLGVNGAGKTTTFKMLMGDEIISSGNAYVSGYSVRTQITKVHKHIGYCPQFDAVFGELTGRETMKIFSMLRGLPPERASTRTEELAYALGFSKHLDKKSEQYSGGNRRKLSTAVALLGDTRLVFVDEPTTGVDPAARRQVWTALQDAQREGRGVVLTSHSMEECEALCTRLTIMVNGRFQCIGAPQHLKNKFSQGFTLIIKMKMDETVQKSTEENKRKVNLVKTYINANFTNPKIMEEYQGLLTYYLSDRNVAWSKMFGIMEKAKKELDIEDYSIAQTTLEQIFLQFTKYEKEGNS